MKLIELEPQFLRYGEDHRGVVFQHAPTIATAQGVLFKCPKCYRENGGPVGTHSIICWSRSAGVPESASPGPGRWKLEGTGYHDLTLGSDPGSRSVLLNDGCKWHGFVTNGEVTDA